MTTQINNTPTAIHTALTATLSYAIVAKELGKRDKNREATYTLTNDESGTHITFRLRRPKGFKTMLVDVMTGSCNESDYEYVGSMNRGLYIKPAATMSDKAAEKLRGVRWYMVGTSKAVKGTRAMLNGVSLHHDGKCACCGRKLTNPESLATGIGPVCEGRL